MRNYTIRLARSIADTTVEHIKDTITTALDEGVAIGELRNRIMDVPGWTDDGIYRRADMIARTESARAYVEGGIESWEKSGVVAGKEWLLAIGACDFCVAASKIMNAELVKLRDVPRGLTKGSVLDLGDGQMMRLDYSDIGGPPLHPNCRCDVQPVLME